MIYYRKCNNFEFENIPITIQEIKKILSESKIINIEAQEELPKGQVIFVGVGNDRYECMTLWDMEYTNHMKLTYGGYFKKDHCGWWTMNYNYSNIYDKTKMYIVNNKDDGGKLAAFLNFTHGLSNIENIICEKENEIKTLQEDINYLKEANKLINENR